MHRQADALIRPDNDVAAIEAEHHSAHAIDEANGLVEVLGGKVHGQLPQDELWATQQSECYGTRQAIEQEVVAPRRPCACP